MALAIGLVLVAGAPEWAVPARVSGERLPPAPSLTGVDPSTGPTGGGTAVNLSGTGFTGVTGVSFGGAPVPARDLRVNSDTLITVLSPAHAGPGSVPVTVSGPGGSSTAATAFRYSGQWRPSGSMPVARSQPLVTLLGCPPGGTRPAGYPCGKVLVAGGRGLASADLFDPGGSDPAGSWTTTGSMGSVRDGATLTLLTDGRVLAAGGRDADGHALRTADLYSPVAGGWTSAGSLTGARSGATATLLSDGSVLVAGGRDDAGPLTSAERYRPGGGPTGGHWSPAGAMSRPRSAHTATLLHGGPAGGGDQVLVVGGLDAGGGPMDTAEIYTSPDSLHPQGAWRATGTMATARGHHIAMLLDDATVLVAGGGTSSFTSAEVFSPLTGGWKATGSLTYGRTEPAAASLSGGRVLIGDGVVLSADGRGAGSSEIYDRATGTWSTTGDLGDHERSRFSFVEVPAGRVMAVGGESLTPPFSALASTELWDETGVPSTPGRPAVTAVSPGEGGPTFGGTPVTITGSDLFPAESVRFGAASATVTYNSATSIVAVSPPHDAATVDITVTTPSAGGGGGPSPASSADRFTFFPAPQPVVTAIAPARGGPTIGRTRVTITGAGFYFAPSQPPTGAAVRFGGVAALRITVDSPTQIRVDSPPRSQPGAVAVTVTTPGGTSAALSAAQNYTYFTPGPTDRGAWNAAKPLDSCAGRAASRCGPRYDQAATRLDGPACRSAVRPPYCDRILVVGGSPQGFPLTTAELYDPTSGSWSATGSMAGARGSYKSTHTLTLLDPWLCHQDPAPADYPCGQVLVVGGENQDLNYGSTVGAELYDPAATDANTGVTGVWRQVGRPATPTFGHAATLLDGPACRTGFPPSYCGEVLVAGGYTTNDGFGVPTSDAELFNPRADRQTPDLGRAGRPPAFWTPAAPMEPCRPANPSCVARSGPGVLLDGPRCHQPSPPAYCGKVLTLSGEVDAHQSDADGNPMLAFAQTAQLYDPAGITLLVAGHPHDPQGAFPGAWEPTGSLAIPRVNYTATVVDGPLCRGASLPAYCGEVLVAGGAVPGPAVDGSESATAEVYDPAGKGLDATGAAVSGAWHAVGNMNEARELHTATLLTSGRVLVVGGGAAVDRDTGVTPRASAEMFDPASARWVETAPMSAARGQFDATLLGGALCESHSPPPFCGRVLVEGGGDSSGLATASAEVYAPVPEVLSLSSSSGPAYGGTRTVISGAGFQPDDTVTFGGVVADGMTWDTPTRITVTTPPSAVRGPVEVAVSGPEGSSMVVPPDPATLFTYDRCDAAAGPGEALYPAAGYSLIGMPSGTRVPADSYLYSWFDQGSGHAYQAYDPTVTAVTGGHGYWAWFSCSRSVALAAPGSTAATFPLAAYHASMVGDPSGTRPAMVTGQDFAARWDPSMNGGAGGYAISEYRQAQMLGVGQGTWVFTYVNTVIDIR